MDYSQCGEQDYIFKFFNNRRSGSFLDLGAHDGICGSNTRGLYKRGWKGVLVEANPVVFSQLMATYSDDTTCPLICAAVESSSKLSKFYYHGGQLGSVRTPMPDVPRGKDFYVHTITPAEIAEVFPFLTFDFVSIDVEGSDSFILPQMTPLLRSTQLICLEKYLPGKANQGDETYYEKLKAMADKLGFSNIYAETQANVLLSRTTPWTSPIPQPVT